MKNKFIIITPTICQGNIPAWFETKDGEEEENARPMVFDTEKDAAVYMLEERIAKLETQLGELKEDHITAEDVDFSEEDFISPCQIDEDGVITTDADGILYDPKTYVR